MARKLLSEQLRQHIDASGMSRYRVCQLIGLPQSTLSRFMSGKGGLSNPTIDALGTLLKLKLVADSSSRR